MSCVEAKLIDKVRPADLPFFFTFERGIGCITNVVAQDTDRQWIRYPHDLRKRAHGRLELVSVRWATTRLCQIRRYWRPFLC